MNSSYAQCPVLLRTTKYWTVLLCASKYYSSTTLYYKVPLHYYKVRLQNYKVLLRTTKNYSGTTPLLLCTTTPVLLCTTKYYCVLKMTCHRHCEEQHRRHCPTSPNTVPATAPKNESHDWISSHIKGYLQCAQQQMSPSNLTKYCARQQKRLTCCILDTYETLFSMCGATSVTLQPHQILRVPRKMTRMLDPRDIWNVNYKARSNRRHPSMSPNIVPATENDHQKFDTNLLKTGETSFTMRSRQSATRRATEVTFRTRHAHLFMKNTTFRAPAAFQISPSIAPATKSDSGTSPNSAPATKSDTWTWASTSPATKTGTSTSPSTAAATKSVTWTSPNIAPASETDFHHWSQCSEHQEPPQCHQILRLPRKITTQNLTQICWKQVKRHLQCVADPRSFQEWSEHETVSPQPAAQPRLLFALATRICLWKIQHFALRLLSKFHQVLRLPRKVTVELHQIVRLPRKATLELEQVLRLPRKLALQLHQVLRLPQKGLLELHQILRLPVKQTFIIDPNAWSTRSHPDSMSPNTAPATENDRPKFDTNLLKTGETSFAMCGRSEIVPRMIRAWNRQSATRRATEVTFRTRHAHLFMKNTTFRAPAAFQISPSIAPATKSDSGTSPNSAPATKSDSGTSPNSAPATKSDTWTWASTSPATKRGTWASRSTAPATKSDNYFYLAYCYLTLLDSTSTWRFLLLDSTGTWLCYVVRISEVSQPKLP